MTRSILRRCVVVLAAVALAHAGGYIYAASGRYYQLSDNPFFAPPPGAFPAGAEYWRYLQTIPSEGLGRMPGGGSETLAGALGRATQASLGLLGLAFALSILVGLALGLLAARVLPPGVSAWLTPLATLAQAMPPFYVGAVLVTAVVFYLLYWAPPGTSLPLPLRGFGWDEHLVLPVLVLAARPGMQIARLTAALLSGEFGKTYVTAARSLGYNWREIRWHVALRNVLAPVVLTIGAAFRLMVVELIVVEWLFGWPGLGSLLAAALIRPPTASVGTQVLPPRFLDPALMAGVLTVFVVLFVLADLAASALARLADPRLRAQEEVARG